MSDPTSARRTRVAIQVDLDAQHNPIEMEWTAEDSGEPGPHACKSFILSTWDAADAGTSQLHLWTPQMRIDDMHKFIHQTLRTLAESYGRATRRADLAQAMHEFADELAEVAARPMP